MVLKYGRTVLVQLTDRVNKPARELDDAVLENAIREASIEIEPYIQGRYPLGFTEIPQVLVQVACILAYANLYPLANEDHAAKAAAKHARKMLEGIAQGKLTIGRTARGETPRTSNTIQFSEGRNDWGKGW